MNEQELEQLIGELIKRKDAVPEGSAEYQAALGELKDLRGRYELAGGIMESLDPFAWGYF